MKALLALFVLCLFAAVRADAADVIDLRAERLQRRLDEVMFADGNTAGNDHDLISRAASRSLASCDR